MLIQIERPKVAPNGQKIIWQPLAGSQALALCCPAQQILYDGSRGPGKTDAQLMFFRKNVGKGYGRFWRGVIFDRAYKNLDDLVSKSQRWFPQFGDGARFLSAKSDYKWVWPTGEELLFRVVKDESDYWDYHGQEFCLAVGEKVCTIDGDKNVEDLKVGDLVLTPSGYRKVNTVFPKTKKPCNLVMVYTAEGALIGSQLQSVDHELLCFPSDRGIYPNQLGTLKPSFDLFHKPPLFRPWTFHPDKAQLFSLDADLKSLLSPAWHQVNARILNSMFRMKCLTFELWHQFYDRKNCKFQGIPPQSCGTYPQQAIERPVLSKLDTPQRKNSSNLHTSQTDLLPQLKSRLQAPRFAKASARLQDGCVDREIATGSQLSYLRGLSQYGELPRSIQETCQDIALQPRRVLESAIARREGDSEYTAMCTQSNQSLDYIHGYSHEKTAALTPFVSGKCVSVPCGEFLTIDFEVDDVNCYCTPFSEFVATSKNCFIGWNELTKYPNDAAYEAMMSCNRSSFIPEDHPLIGKDGSIELLPDIPLTVFSTTNPYGSGHSWVKEKFIDVSPPGVILSTEKMVFNPKTQMREPVVKTQVRIFGSYKENIYLAPEYIAELESITDPNKRGAWLEGRWDITSGGMFDDLWRDALNIVPRFEIPHTWRIDRSFDYGSSRPFSVGWWAESDGSDVVLANGQRVRTVRGDLFRINEWYGCSGKANEGLRMLATEIAQGIVAREISFGIHNRVVPGPADNSIYDLMNGNSIAADMEKPVVIEGRRYRGVQWTRSDKSAGSRKHGWESMRKLIKQAQPQVDATGNYIPRETPGLFVMENCVQFKKLVPSLPRDEKDPDDVDTEAEDHMGDEVRYRVLAHATGARSNKTKGHH